MERKTAAVIFGGQSSEHEVSCMSAANVIDRINKEKYDVFTLKELLPLGFGPANLL